MGVVHEALDARGEQVALKLLHADLSRGADAKKRFVREMAILAELSHPNIVRSLGSFESEGRLVLVLELLRGRTLRAELERVGRLPLERALSVVRAVLAALVVAHERATPIVHRDLKPENIMLLDGGSVKIMDFGIAKILDEKQERTRTTQIVGTAQYMSPEQIDGRAVTPRADLYALGLIAYEMLSGAPPFQSSSVLAIIRDQCETAPPPLSPQLQAALPPALVSLVFRLLEKSADRRPESARAVLATLSSLGAAGPEPVLASAAPTPEVATRKDTIEIIERLDKRPRWPRALGVAIALSVVVAGLVALGLFLSARDRDSQATDEDDVAEEGSAAPTVRVDTDGQLRWIPAAAWERVASANGVAANYRVPRAPGDAEDAAVEIRVITSTAEETRARLRRQFDVCGPACDVVRSTKVGGAEVTLVELSGTFWGPSGTGPARQGFALVGAIVPVESTTYLVQLSGPEKSVAKARADFDKLVQGLRKRQ